jgi:hypothetical protein
MSRHLFPKQKKNRLQYGSRNAEIENQLCEVSQKITQKAQISSLIEKLCHDTINHDMKLSH